MEKPKTEIIEIQVDTIDGDQSIGSSLTGSPQESWSCSMAIRAWENRPLCWQIWRGKAFTRCDHARWYPGTTSPRHHGYCRGWS